MFKLFLEPRYPDLEAFIKFPEWGYLEKYVKDNIFNIRTYCRGIEELCSERNMIVKFLQVMTLDYSLPDEKFLQKLIPELTPKANILGIGVGNNRPSILKDSLNLNSFEIFTGEVDEKTYRFYLKNKIPWQEWIPLKPVYHTYKVLDYEIREGRRDLRNQLILYHMDLITLVLMFKQWIQYRREKDKSTKPHIFVQQFVLPNTLEYDLNLVFFNKVTQFSIESKILPVTKSKYPIFIKEVGLLIDKVLIKACNTIKLKGVEYERLLNTIPVITNPFMKDKKMLEVLKLSDIYFRVQMKWVLWLSRLSYIKGLLLLGSTATLQKNRDYNLSLQEDLKEYSTGNIFIKESLLGNNAYATFINDLYFIKDLILPSLNIKL